MAGAADGSPPLAGLAMSSGPGGQAGPGIWAVPSLMGERAALPAPLVRRHAR